MLSESASSTTIKQHCHTVTTPVIFYAGLISNSFPALNKNDEFSCWYPVDWILWPMVKTEIWKNRRWIETNKMLSTDSKIILSFKMTLKTFVFRYSVWTMRVAFQTCHSWIKKDFQVPSTIQFTILFNCTKLFGWFAIFSLFC